jgi:hypothetical protein
MRTYVQAATEIQQKSNMRTRFGARFELT